MRKSVIILCAAAALLIAVNPLVGKEDEVAFRYDKLLKKSFDERGDGSIVPVTVETATELDGTISANGEYMFYASDRERGNFDIYLRSMTDITTVRVTSHSSKDISPAVSPDGRHLAFVSYREDPQGDVYVLDTDPAEMLTAAESPNAASFDKKAANISLIRDPARDTVMSFRDADPAWTPDGKRIVFSSTRNGGENLFVCDRTGKDLRQITTKGGMSPRFSEDGSSVVFVSYRDNAVGDIYTIDIAGGTEKRVTDEPGIKIYPSFGNTKNEISYTRIDKDTNRDGKTDYQDRSILIYKNISRGETYPLTLGSVSSFRGRYFPAYPLSYVTTKEPNYHGVILYSEQTGSNININIIPEHGVIPRRKDAMDQFDHAEELSFNQEDADRVILAFLRVYQFHPVKNDPSPYTVRALYRAALGYRDNGDPASARNTASMLRSLSKSGDDYCGVKASILDAVLSGKDPAAQYQSAIVRGVEKKNASFIKEDAADYWLAKGDNAKAEGLYRGIISSDEKFKNAASVKFQLGMIEAGRSVSIPASLTEVYKVGRQTHKDKTNLAIISILAREKNARKRIGMIESLRARFIDSSTNSTDSASATSATDNADQKNKSAHPILPVLAYAEGLSYQESGDLVNAEEWYKKALASIRTTELLYYEANVRMAEIAVKQGKSAEEEKYLSLVANNYLPRWNRPDFKTIINRLISYYENTGANFEASGKYDKAADLYTRYIRILTYLHLRKKFEDVYNEYAPRAHVLYIDSYSLSKSDPFEAFDYLEKQYLQRRDIARMDFDKAYIYGLAYIYAKRGAEQEKRLDAGTKAPADDAYAENYLTAQTHLAWAFFMDDTFVDPYLLQGWINQAIDLRRKKLQAADDTFKLSKLNKMFSTYLWERNKSVYEKGIQAVDAARFPDKSGSLHLNLGNTYFLLSNYPLALENYERAALQKKSFGSRKEESLFRYHLSYCYWQAGKTAEAKREMLRVYETYSQLASSATGRQYAEQLSNIDEYMAMYERMLGNYTESIKWHERAIADGGDRLRSDLSRITLEIAWCAMKAGDYPRAIRMCSTAETLLDREPSDDKEFILRLYLFRMIGINFYDLGPDKVVIGDSRIFAHLSVAQKKLFLLSIREELGLRKGDYTAVVNAVNAKLEILKGRETEADKEATIRAYNGVGNSLFRLGRYADARDYFEKGWVFATGSEVNNLRGAFVSIKNLVSLYGFILENEPVLFTNPQEELARLDSRIEKFRAGYENTRYAELEAEIVEEAEARDKPVDQKKLADARIAASLEAKTVYTELDASRAVIDFYRAEFTPDDSNSDPIKVYHDAASARGMYLRAGKVFESSVQIAGLTVSHRIKMYMNAALCREKTGYIQNAYELLGKAERLASDSKRDELLWEIYYREALFIKDHGKEIEENPITLSEKYFLKAIALVEKVPALYAGSSRVGRLYRDYVDLLIGKNDFNNALSAHVRAFSIERIFAAARLMSYSADRNVRDDLALYQALVVRLNDAKRARSIFIESGSPDIAGRKAVDAAVVSIEKEIAAFVSDVRARSPMSASLMEPGRNDISPIPGKEFIVIVRHHDAAVIWKIGSSISHVRIPVSDIDAQRSFISGSSPATGKRFVLMDEDAFDVMDKLTSKKQSVSGINFTWAPSIQWIRSSGNERNESPAKIGAYDRDARKARDLDIIVCADAAKAESIIGEETVSPVVIIAPSMKSSRMRWITESALRNGVRSVVFAPANTLSTIADTIKKTEGSVSSLQNGEVIRIAGYDDIYVRGDSSQSVAQFHENGMTAALSRGDARGAITASMRYDSVTGKPGVKSMLVRARAHEILDSPASIDYAREAAASGLPEAVSYYIYSLLNSGNPAEAYAVLNSFRGDRTSVPEMSVYSRIVSAMKTGSSLHDVSAPDKAFVDQGHLQILIARYRSLTGEKPSIRRIDSLSYPLSEIQSLSGLRFGAVDQTTLTQRAQILKAFASDNGTVSTEQLDKISRIDDYCTTIAYTLALEKGVSGSSFVRFLRGIDLSRIRTDNDSLVTLDFLLRYADGCRRAKDKDRIGKAIDKEIEIASSRGFVRIANGARIERASRSSAGGKYKDASNDLSAVSGTVAGTDVETKFKLVMAEVALFSGNVKEGDALLGGLKTDSGADLLTAELLRAFSDRRKLIATAAAGKDSKDKGSPAVAAGMAQYETRMKQALSYIEPRVMANSESVRRDLLESGINFLVSINHLKRNNLSSILYEEMKRQIDRWDVSGIGSDTFLSSVDVAGFQKKLSDDEVAVYISRNESDIFAWIIGNNSISPVRIQDGYDKVKNFNTRYSDAVRQMQNIYPLSVELEQLLSPAFKTVWKKKRVYIIPDKYTESVPFEVMVKEKMLAEQVEMCYLSSIASLSYGKISAPKRAVISGGSADMDSIALNRAGMIRKSGTVGFGHFVTRVTLFNGSIVSSADGSESINDERFPVMYFSRGVTGGNLFAYGPTAGKYGAFAVIIASPSVRDVNSVVFAENFYTKIGKGEGLVSAFSSAMKATMRISKYAHPAFWAGTRLYINGMD